MNNSEDYWDLMDDDYNSDYQNSVEDIYDTSDLFERYEYSEWLDSDDEDYSRPQKIKSNRPKEKNYVKPKKNNYRKEKIAKKKERESAIEPLKEEIDR